MDPITPQPEQSQYQVPMDSAGPSQLSGPKHFLNKKFAITFVVLLLLGGGAYASIWWWQKQQVVQEVIEPTPRPEMAQVSEWKIFETGDFTIRIPLTWDTRGSDRSGAVESKLSHIVFDVSPLDNNYQSNLKDLYLKGKFAEAEQLRYSDCRESCLKIKSSVPIIMDGVQGAEFVLDDSINNQPAKTSVLYREVVKDNLLYRFYTEESNQLPDGSPLPQGLIEAANSFEIFRKVLSTFLFNSVGSLQTYQNIKYGFEIKYPKQGFYSDFSEKINETENNQVFAAQGNLAGDNPEDPSTPRMYFSIYALPLRSTDGVTCKEAAKGYTLKYEIVGSIVIDGKPYPKCIITQSAGDKSVHISFNRNNYTWEFIATHYDLYENMINQILSTFKFTDSVAGQFCGGIAGVACPSGYNCKLDGTYPDAGGTCVLK